jgi:protein SCO1/2
MRTVAGILIVLSVLVSACRRGPEPRQYPLTGQILSIDAPKQEVLVNHEDIPGFMAAMTMPYKVKEPALLEGKQPGDLFTGTLVVESTGDAYLSALTKTGTAPIVSLAAAPLITASDLLKEGDRVPDNVLVDQDKTARTMTSLRGHRVALTFTYTRCPMPDFCPRMDRNFAEVQKIVAATPELADVRLVSVTLDPEFDTPAVLKTHAQRLQADPARWHFVTGDRDEVLAFAKRFGVTAEPPAAAGEMMVHNLRTAVIDPDGRLVKVHSGTSWTPTELVADLKAAPAPAH